MKLRRASRRDARRVWTWANDRATRSASYSSAAIPWEDHVRWFDRKLADRDRVAYYIAEEGGMPVGQIRLERIASGRAEISFAVAPRSRGRGYGVPLLLGGCRRGARDLALRSVFGWVKEANVASVRVFDRAGFRRVRRLKHKGFASVLYSLRAERLGQRRS